MEMSLRNFETQPDHSQPDHWSSNDKQKVAEYLDLMDRVSVTHTELTKAAKALKKLDVKQTKDATYRTAVKSDDEASAAYQSARQALRDAEPGLGDLLKTLDQFDIEKKSGREALRNRLHVEKTSPTTEDADTEVIPPIELTEDEVATEVISELELNKDDEATEVNPRREEEPTVEAGEKTALAIDHNRIATVLAAADRLSRTTQTPPRIARFQSAPIDEPPAPVTTFFGRLRESRAARWAAGLLFGAKLLSGASAELAQQDTEKKSLDQAMEEIAKQSPYESPFADLPSDDDILHDTTTRGQVKDIIYGSVERLSPAEQAKLGPLYMDQVKALGAYSMLSEKCGITLSDGSEGLDMLKCDLLYGNQVKIKDNSKEQHMLDVVSGTTQAERELAGTVLRDSLVHSPTAIVVPGSYAGMIYHNQRELPKMYNKVSVKEIYDQQYQDALDLTLGVIRELDLPHQDRVIRETVVDQLQEVIEAQIDLRIRWLNVSSTSQRISDEWMRQSLKGELVDPDTGAVHQSQFSQLQHCTKQLIDVYKQLSQFDNGDGILLQLPTSIQTATDQQFDHFVELGLNTGSYTDVWQTAQADYYESEALASR